MNTRTDASQAGLPIDTSGLAEFLSGCPLGAGPLGRIERLTGGISNVTLMAEYGDRRLVLRRRPLGSIPEQSHDMRREFETLGMLASRPVPVPEVFAYCDDESILGAPFYAMEFVDGLVIQSADDVKPLAGVSRIRACHEVVDILARLHAIPLSEIPTYQPGRTTDVMPRHLRRWHTRWTERPHRDLPAVDQIADAIGSRLAPSTELCLVHGDYRIGNTIISPDAEPGAVRAVLDWELCTFGHPLTDLAHLLAYWEGTGNLVSHRAQRIAADAGLPGANELAERYAAVSGRNIQSLPLFIAFEHWRAAIIKEAIYQRHLETGAPEDQTDDARAGVESHLAEAAARLETAPC